LTRRLWPPEDFISPQNERDALQLLRHLIREQLEGTASSLLDAATAAADAAAARLCAPANEECMRVLPPTDRAAARYKSWLAQWHVSDAVGLGEEIKKEKVKQQTGREAEEVVVVEVAEADIGLRRGVVACRDVRVGEPVFQVPCGMLLSVDTALASEIGATLRQVRPLLRKQRLRGNAGAGREGGTGEGAGERAGASTRDGEGEGEGEGEGGGGEEEEVHDDSIAMLFLLHQRAQGARSPWASYFEHLPPSIYTAVCPEGVHTGVSTPAAARQTTQRGGRGEGAAEDGAGAGEGEGGKPCEAEGIDWEWEMAGTPLLARGEEERGVARAGAQKCPVSPVKETYMTTKRELLTRAVRGWYAKRAVRVFWF